MSNNIRLDMLVDHLRLRQWARFTGPWFGEGDDGN